MNLYADKFTINVDCRISLCVQILSKRKAWMPFFLEPLVGSSVEPVERDIKSNVSSSKVT